MRNKISSCCNSALCMTIVIVFEKNRLEPDRLNEKIERFILILFKHDPLYNVSQGKKYVLIMIVFFD